MLRDADFPPHRAIFAVAFLLSCQGELAFTVYTETTFETLQH